MISTTDWANKKDHIVLFQKVLTIILNVCLIVSFALVIYKKTLFRKTINLTIFITEEKNAINLNIVMNDLVGAI